MPTPCNESDESDDQSLVIKRDEQGRIVLVIDHLVGHSQLTSYEFDPALPLEQLFDEPESTNPPAA